MEKSSKIYVAGHKGMVGSAIVRKLNTEGYNYLVLKTSAEVDSRNQLAVAGIKLCENYRRQYGCNFISAMPCNLYGPNDNYDLNKSHVIPALTQKFHEAKIGGHPSVVIWGTGLPLREFLHVADLASACHFLMQNYTEKQFINVGSGEELSINELAELIKDVVTYKGVLTFDHSKPDGTPRKIIDSYRLIKMGWEPKILLREGLFTEYRN